MENNKFESGKPVDNAGNTIKNKTGWREDALAYLQDIVHALAVILLLFLLLFRIVIVNGPSMEDTLVHNDCVILLNSLFHRNFSEGDIVVISKESFRDGEPIIKRIVATENQRVDIDFESGIVYVDDTPVSEPYTKTPTNLKEGIEFPLTVPEGCVFVMGDNRNDSKDSRSCEIGMIDTRQILGKAFLLVFPGANPDTQQRQLNRIGAL